MPPEAYRGYLEGNVIKYLWRHRLKGGREDLRKAQWYLDRLLECWSNDSSCQREQAL